MKVNGGNTGPLRPDRPRDPQSAGDARESRGARTPSQMERLDRVEISDAGRARAGRLEPVDRGNSQRLAEIRQRVLRGAYDADTVAGEVARRILDRGDL